MGTYRVPLRTLTRLGLAMLRRGETTLLRDAAELVAAITPPPAVHGAEHLPATGPFVAVANHYQRRGLWIGFPSALLTTATARRRPGAPPLHWAIVAETRLAGGRLPVPGTAWAYREVARCYEMVELPARRGAVGDRASALRRLAGLALPPPRGRGEPIALYPEGERGSATEVHEALAGTGGFLLLLAAAGVPVVPVGFAEVDSRLCARIGEAFLLRREDGDRRAADLAARQQTMRRVADLLPPIARRSPAGPPEDPAAGGAAVGA